jgi:ribosomal protein S18 acetylase RimI-like enzyme
MSDPTLTGDRSDGLDPAVPLPAGSPTEVRAAPTEVREAVPADVAPLAAGLWDLPLLGRYGVTEAGLRRDLEGALARGEGLVVAVHAGEPVGFAWFLEHGTFALGGYLRLIAVRPGHQGGNLGARLLDEVERRVAARSRALFLLVSGFNTAAQRFYERHGYERVGTLGALVRPDIDEEVFWKRLR